MYFHIYYILFFFLLCNNITFIVKGSPPYDDCTSPLLHKSTPAEEIEILKKQPFIAISLGENCNPAEHLVQHNIRIRSFPFDWNITSVESLCMLLTHDFEGLLDPKNLVIRGDMVRNTRYNIIFAHNFDVLKFYDGPNGFTPKDADAQECYNKTVSEYQRRIARFYSVFNIGIPIYLFRRVITSNEAKKLHTLLKRKFPTSNFKLICIEDGPIWEDIKKWNIPGIIHFKMKHHEHPTHTPGKPNAAWSNVLIQLGILTKK